jgi:hypothetical protein
MISISHWGMFAVEGYERTYLLREGYSRGVAYLQWDGNE